MITALLSRSDRDDKKYCVIVYVDGVKVKTVHFGDPDYEDYTMHGDPDRKKKYIARHKTKNSEDWTINGITTAGFWSRWLLWNLPDLEDSIYDTEKRFGIEIDV